MTTETLFKYTLFSLFIVAMHFLMATPGGTGLYLSFNTSTWLVTSLLLSIALWQVSNVKQLYFYRSDIIFFIGVALLWLPYSYSGEFKDHVILQLLAATGGLCFLISLSQFDSIRRKKDTLLWLILYATMFQCLFSTIEFFILKQGDLSGFDPTKNRPFGLLLQPNVLASLLATAITIALYLTSQYSRRNTIKQTLLSCIIFIASFYLITMNSRAGVFGGLLALLFISPYLHKIAKPLMIKNFIIIAIAIGLANVALFYHPVSQYKKPEENVQVRKDIYQMSLQMISDKPFLGYGYGSFERSYLEYHNKQRLSAPSINPPVLRLDHPHNEVLYWGVEGGLAALLGLVCFVWGYFYMIRSIPWQRKLALGALITPILFHTQVEFPFYNASCHWLILLVLIFYTLQDSKQHKQSLKISSSLLPRFFAILLSIIFVPFFLTTLHTGYIVTQYENSTNKSIKSFNNIINPLPWRSRIEADINAHRLVVGYRDKNRQLLYKYIKWGLERVKHAPRISIYNNVLVSLKILDEPQRYQQVLAEAKQLYPDHKQWKSETLSSLNDTFDKTYL